MLCDYQIEWVYVVINQFVVAGELFGHVYGLKEQVEEFLGFLLHFGVGAFHLVYEVAEGKLGVEDAAVLTLFDSHVVEDFCLLEA